MKAIVVHGHFYQPPRENPWTREVQREAGAEPFHNWNERIFEECYRANAYARVLDEQGRVEAIVNNYLHLSFNFGPTLLSWMERHHPITYARILEADRESAFKRAGHGNAIGQAYNHCILPLCNERDQRTQIRWGLADFHHRFGRASEGLWLPETACNHGTLDALIEQEVKFTILSPYQATQVRPFGSDHWHDVVGGRIDPTMPYAYFHSDGSGRAIDIFFYDGPKSRAIAFESLLGSSRRFMDHLTNHQDGAGGMVSVATDGESYGHHFSHGERCIAHALTHEAPRRGVQVTNYAEYLEHTPPHHEVRISEGPEGLGSAWSCAHGVGRWFRDCGCHTGGHDGWNQAWRGPLRQALDLLRDDLAGLFEEKGQEYFEDPWAARDDYVQVLLEGSPARGRFFERHSRRELGSDERIAALELLECQHHAMLMYTSCGWFFNDLSGIETQQILKYAGRALEYAEQFRTSDVRTRFLDQLAEAHSNWAHEGNGADVFRRHVDPSSLSPKKIVANVTMSSLVEDLGDTGQIGGYVFERQSFTQRPHGRLRLGVGIVDLKDNFTERTYRYASGALYLGGVDFYCVVNDAPDDEELKDATARMVSSFPTVSVPAMLRQLAAVLGPDEYGVEHLLPEAREQISSLILDDLVRRFSEQYANLYEDNQRALDILQSTGFEVPKELRAAAEFTLGRRFEEEIRQQQESLDPAAYKRAVEMAEAVADFGYKIDRSASSRTFEHMISHAVQVALGRPGDETFATAISLVDLAQRLHLEVDLGRSQEAVYLLARRDHVVPKDKLTELAIALRLTPGAIDPESSS